MKFCARRKFCAKHFLEIVQKLTDTVYYIIVLPLEAISIGNYRPASPKDFGGLLHR
jgi:hypothetical protein